jgi:hypothetical protein
VERVQGSGVAWGAMFLPLPTKSMGTRVLNVGVLRARNRE